MTAPDVGLTTRAGMSLLDNYFDLQRGSGPQVYAAIRAVEDEAREQARPAPDTALREDAGYLADAAKHLTDHLASEHPDWHCEDMDVVQHFAVKIRAALAETKP